ncbi:FusB/FusC family EF-G-binding protein [Enterococcus villorum]|uniref:Elongation factor G-binding protein n=2 Tax=Enterococcus villorum TaxID=112904 RepID=A0A511J0T7_9ENTE|nr:elongation factor G-binding protein [Enterococcus villorum]EOH86199.1 fibronectin-binding protein [Enterococcus villorum ATCC 700913]EOW78727.1 fibronectin-binding protein [Enterococcus villorum ATCC 700913]GEL91594.1 elongation factor G-binding protein [Enterococcus villorum]
MEQSIKPYQYFFIKREVTHLLSVYHSVNDPKTVATVQAQAVEKIKELLDSSSPIVDLFLENILDATLKKEKAERLLEELKESVLPFEQPTKIQIEKLFRKVKKLKQPDWQHLDLKECTYIGWNDSGSQKKFMIYYDEQGKLSGIHGALSPTVTKGICTICKKTSSVSLFLATTKSNSDGTYTKKGNYICHDSEQCNHHLVQLAPFYEFTELVKKER